MTTKLILCPPYRNPVINPVRPLSEIVALMKRKGQLEGVEVDIDEGTFVDTTTPSRDEEVMAILAVNVIKQIRKYSEMGKHDAIVLTGGCEPGFVPGRLVSKIPVAGALHSSLHVASLIGDRTCVIGQMYEPSLRIRHLAERYGFGHKLVSVRPMGHPSTPFSRIVDQDNKEERFRGPEGRMMMDAVINQCKAAIEEDRVDSLILSNEPLSTLEEDIRQRLDEAGYEEIPLILPVPAAVEMAKAMVNLELIQAPRAYPSVSLKAKPEFC
jgi:Asp/Glu/hydantoin racemase